MWEGPAHCEWSHPWAGGYWVVEQVMGNRTVGSFPPWFLHQFLPWFPFMVHYNCKLLVALGQCFLPQSTKRILGHHFTRKYKLKNTHYLFSETGLKGGEWARVPQLNFYTSSPYIVKHMQVCTSALYGAYNVILTFPWAPDICMSRHLQHWDQNAKPRACEGGTLPLLFWLTSQQNIL